MFIPRSEGLPLNRFQSICRYTTSSVMFVSHTPWLSWSLSLSSPHDGIGKSPSWTRQEQNFNVQRVQRTRTFSTSLPADYSLIFCSSYSRQHWFLPVSLFFKLLTRDKTLHKFNFKKKQATNSI